MILAAERETLHLAPNPRFLPNQPWSYETVLCRLGGWWTMGQNRNGERVSSLTPREVVALRLANE